MWNKQKISVVLPAYNEAENIAVAVKDFLSASIVDEVIVVDNNSTDGTVQKAKAAGARVIKETRQGYGWANRLGLREANGDIIITAEPDGTFVANDIFKLLSYSTEFEAVFGSRTHQDLIGKGAKMNLFLKIGNIFVAKLIQFLYSSTPLTDVGCTMKLIKRSSLKKIQPKFSVGTSHFSPEFMVLCIKNNIKCIEIPVNYRHRIGTSKITVNNWKAFKLGLRMIWLIISYRFRQ
jgi:glycosyltransferase involved in cell wall biosynthesis